MVQETGKCRNTIDKYYTKRDIVDMCIGVIKSVIVIGENDLVIEPSAGNGSFVSGIKSLSRRCEFYDLEPEHSSILKRDFLEYTHESGSYKTHVMGNPPFGRQSSLAIKFIKKSCEFCETVSFILPRSFKKDSLKKHFPVNFHLVTEVDLPSNGFTVNGIEHDVPCVFQIWERRNEPRVIEKPLTSSHFEFVKRHENPDISFRRVGVNSGKVDKDFNDKSIQSHYFIKFTNGNPLEKNIDVLSKIEYKFDNTVGPRSISKQELVKLSEEAFYNIF